MRGEVVGDEWDTAEEESVVEGGEAVDVALVGSGAWAKSQGKLLFRGSKKGEIEGSHRGR